MATKKKSAAKKRSPAKKKSPLKKKAAPTRKPAAKKKVAPKKKTTLRKQITRLIKKTTALVMSAAPARPLLKSSPPPAATKSTLTFLTESLPTFTVGRNNKFTIEAVGGTPPYSFQLTEGRLTPGLKFDESGTLYGTPMKPDDTTIMIRLTDSAKAGLNQAFALRADIPS